jgi:two-component system, cell cycle sensor histidine kinase and response regulator CckA
MAQDAAQGDGKDLHVMLEEAEQACLRARDLTQQLLTFAKGGTPIKQQVLPTTMIKEAAEFAVRGSPSCVDLHLAEDLWSLDVDPSQIGQVIRNLVINADQAMPGGGAIAVVARNVELAAEDGIPVAPGRYVRIAITDTGVGIPELLMDKIFDPYFTTKESGSGLGLATSLSIVKKHGGYITLRSVVDVGTTFDVYLPATRSVLTPVKTESARQKITGRARILVMDDEQAIRQLAKRMLASSRYEVETATNGAEAIQLYDAARQEGRPFDAVVLDLTVQGGMGGKETIRRLLEKDPSVRAVVSSGYSMDPVMANFREFGFQGVVAKPYQMESFLNTLRAVLEGKS